MHCIRLRGPWLKSYGASTATHRIEVPEGLGGNSPVTNSVTHHRHTENVNQDANAPVHYQRTFNRPTGLDASTRVMLCLEHWIGCALELRMNEHSLPLSSPPLKVDITQYLEQHNRVRLTLVARDTPALPRPILPTLDGEVSLAIVTD